MAADGQEDPSNTRCETVSRNGNESPKEKQAINEGS